MKVLLIGGGGREHALAWRLADSPRVTALYALPGNPGIADVAELVPGSVMEFDKIERFAKQQKIDLVVIGPEDPLAAGLTDQLTKAGLRVFGPAARRANTTSTSPMRTSVRFVASLKKTNTGSQANDQPLIPRKMDRSMPCTLYCSGREIAG